MLKVIIDCHAYAVKVVCLRNGARLTYIRETEIEPGQDFDQ